MTPTTGDPEPPARSAWDDALLAAACIAVDPAGLGGVHLRAAVGPVRDAWTAHWRALLSASTPVRTVPLRVDDGRLLGGLDLTESLRAGRPVEQPGLLAEVDGGYALLSMAERIEPSTAARIAAVVETGDRGRGPRTRFGVIAFDEGDAGEGEGAADTLVERLALCVDLHGCSVRSIARVGPSSRYTRSSVDAARAGLSRVEVGDEVVGALCAAAVALGIGSMRMPTYAVRAARAIAALDGRDVVDGDDAATVARLVFAARACRLAAERPAEQRPHEEGSAEPRPDADSGDVEADPDSHAAAPPDEARDEVDDEPASDGALDEVVLEAAVAAIPADLLRRLAAGAGAERSGITGGSGAGSLGNSQKRGAPAGVRRRRPRPPERLSLVETLRAAAPWQRVRRAEASGARQDRQREAKVEIRVEDLHVVRFKQRHPTTTVFVVDASGSAALHRLAEAKGAVELLLGDCYVRRDSVAVLAFRGSGTQLLLPPTRSLVRARRSLAGLPGGGGTPLASALDATRELLVALRRRGETVLAIVLTDGRANVARDGSGGRPKAEADALVSARALRALDVDALLIDTSPQPHPNAARIAAEMGATYRPLPYAGATEMSAIVNQAARRRAAVGTS